MENLIKNVQNFSHQNNLFGQNSKIVVGVSGGPDSACLLDIFSKLKNKCKLEIVVAHVNYGLRGCDSDKDEKLVRELAKKYRFPVNVLRAEKTNSNSEEDLRNLRYDFFEKMRKKNKFEFIAVAHTMNDQAETVLLRIMRGTGLDGLSAMKPKNERIIRPMLFSQRAEILKYLESNRLNFRMDKTNYDRTFTRNRVRNALLPYLEKYFNPAIIKSLAVLASNAAEDYDFIRLEAARRLKRMVEKKKGILEFKNSQFQKLHPAIQKEILRQMIETLRKDGLKNIESANLEEIKKVLLSRKGKAQKVRLKELNLTRKGDKVILRTD
jgi:tRNA(Ile)-lysidine synthase